MQSTLPGLLRLAGLFSLGLAVLNGCGPDTSGPPPLTEPPNLSTYAGNNQEAMPATLLPERVIARATTTDGAPLAGYSVEWSVVEGGGKLEGAEPTTDFAGYSYAHWTLGPAPGPQQAKVTVTFKTVEGATSSLSAVFSAVALGPPPPKPVILHYDGTSWSVSLAIEASAASVPAANLNSIWGSSRSNIFAVGQEGCCSGSGRAPLIARYNGTSWAVLPVDFNFLMDSRNASGSSVWGTSDSNILTVMTDRYPTGMSSSLLRFDGSTWSNRYTRMCGSPTLPVACPPFLNAIWSDSPANVVAVGHEGFIVRYNGTAWTEDVSGTTKQLHAVWGVPSATPARVFAVGDAGTILVYDGKLWQPQASGTTEPLYGVWGTSANDVFAVGGSVGTGVILHYDGTAWSSQHSSGPALRGVWGATGSSVFAVGDGPIIRYYNGSTWTQQTVNAAIDLRGVWGSSASDVYAVGHGR